MYRVARAMRLMADGVIDRDGMPGLAAHLGYSVRQVQRLLLAELGAGPLRDLSTAISRCRRLLDLDADPISVDDQLRSDRALTSLVDKDPGRRVPRTVDGPELAMRTVLGQQVSTAAARTLAGRLVVAYGDTVADPEGGLTRLFPEPAHLAALDPAALALPRARGDALMALVTALADGEIDLDAGSDWQRTRTQLAALSGIEPWTVETIAMRALGDPDAFPPTDPGVRLAARSLGLSATPAALVHHASAWRPWRAYAVQYLWAANDHAINRLPTTA